MQLSKMKRGPSFAAGVVKIASTVVKQAITLATICAKDPFREIDPYLGAKAPDPIAT